MQRVSVTSSVLRSIGYHAASRTLEAEFEDGDVYRYYEVPRRKHDALMRSESHGEYFNREIKQGGYRYRKLPRTVK